MRDSQKTKLYRAEREAFRESPGRDVRTPARYEARLRAITTSKWMRSNFKCCPLEVPVEYSDTMMGANASAWRIRTGTYSMTEWVLIHELAHVIHQRMVRWDTAGHGRQYAELYLKLVRRFMGADAYKRLRTSFRKHKVKVGKKRQLSAAQKIGNAAGLAAWREKQKQLAKGA
jgi:hypothetical protein